MTETRSGRKTETEEASGGRQGETGSGEMTGTKVAHDLPPNPEPAEGPRDKAFTQETVSDASADDQPKQFRKSR
jgi:hypothetical protein